MLRVEDFDLWESAVFVHSGPDRDHDIDNMHHGFLVSRGVVPPDWEKTESEATRYYSEISYENGMTMSVDRNFIRVIQAGDLEYGEKYESVELLTRYIISVEKDALGGPVLRWDLGAPHDNPGEWIIEYLVHPRIMEVGWDDLRSHMTFDIGIRANSDVWARSMFFTFSTFYTENDSGEEQGYVNVTCGIRQEALRDNNELVEWFSVWREHEKYVLDALGSFLGVDND